MINQEEVPKKDNRTLKIVLWITGVVVITAIIVAVVWWLYARNADRNISEAESVVGGVTQDISTSTAGSEFFANKVLGYSLEYPDAWQLDEDTYDNSVKIYPDTTDVQHIGVLVTIYPDDTEKTDYTDIEEYLNNKQISDTSGAQSINSPTYSDVMGVKIAASESDSPKMKLYSWICGGQVMSLTYQGADFDKYLDQFNTILDSMVLCAG